MRAFILVMALFCAFISERAAAQTTWSTTGNAGTNPGTNFIGTTDSKDLVFKIQNIERGRIINTGGVWRFGNSSNFAKIDGGGKLTFGGTGVYQVAANKYVFQYAGSPNIGLYYNASSSAHEFRDNNGSVAARVSALSGNGYFKGNLGVGTTSPSYKLDVSGTGRFTGALRVGSYTLPTSAGGAGQVLTSNGTGSVTWTTPSGGGGASQWASNGTSISYSAGNVGVGTSTPAYKLHVAGTGYFSGTLKVGAYTLPTSVGTAGQVLTTSGAGTTSWTTVSGSGGGTNPWAVNGSNISYTTGNVGVGTTSPSYRMDVSGTGRFTGTLKVGAYTLPATDGTTGQVLTSNGTGTVSWTTVSGGGTSSQWSTSGSNISYTTGNVGIGTTDLAAGYKLSVSGKIMCEEVKVQLASNWPDYVFSKDYSLLPLEDLESSIEAHQHLPGIPSAKEVAAEGVSIGDMQVKMMEKIEELTLYLIDANKEMNHANTQIATLQNNVDQLQQRIRQLEKSGN